MFNFSSVRRPVAIALALTTSIAMVACDGKETPKPTATVTGVTVNVTPATIAKGSTAQATAVVTVTNNAAKTVTWTSSAPTVATVDSTGKVTGVSAGDANIIATSTVDKTKVGQAKITVTDTVTPPTRTTAMINFGPAGTTATGYTILNDGSTGWVTEATAGTATPNVLDLSANARSYKAGDAGVAAGKEAAQYSQINMQCGTATDGNNCFKGDRTSGAFELTVVNGKYNVKVSVGDALEKNVNSVYAINVEGQSAIAPFTPAPGEFKTGTVTVDVTDGKLTVDAKNGKNTKINYLEVTPAN